MIKDIMDKFACPYDHNNLRLEKNNKIEYFFCIECKRKYEVENNIPNFLPDEIRSLTKNTELSKNEEKKWLPGYRGWKPSFLAKILSFRFSGGSGRIKVKIDGNLLILDVGVGDDYNGNINTDIYIPNPIPPNFILASAERLPFKDSSFDTVRSAYVIEHCLFPVEFIKEQIRVSKKTVKIYTDNSDWLGAIVYRILNIGSIFHDEHYYKWSKEYFANILRRLSIKGRVFLFNSSPSLLIKLISYLGRLPRIGPLFYRDLGVEIEKNNT